MSDDLIIGRDYYLDAAGRYVFTADYLRRRGTCCGSGCRHCPYGHVNVPRNAGMTPSSAEGTAPRASRRREDARREGS